MFCKEKEMSASLFYDVLGYIPRHGISQEMLRHELVIFLISSVLNSYLTKKGIYIVSASSSRIRHLLSHLSTYIEQENNDNNEN